MHLNVWISNVLGVSVRMKAMKPAFFGLVGGHKDHSFYILDGANVRGGAQLKKIRSRTTYLNPFSYYTGSREGE